MFNFQEGNIYHILNRGVEKRKIFLNEEDYLRFVNNLEDFNNREITLLSYKNRRRQKYSSKTRLNPLKMVNILYWCLLPNHFHILTQEIFEGGASLFSKKLTVGYTMYFNKMRDRSGVLFQGRSKIILIKDESHFLWTPFYILANPLNLYQFDWKENGLKDVKSAFNFLLNYRWSNFKDIFGGATSENGNYKKEFLEWLESYRS